jgi:hypothetical protein
MPYEQDYESEDIRREARLIEEERKLEEEMNKAKLKKQLDDYIEKANLHKENHLAEHNNHTEVYPDSTFNQPKAGLSYDQVNKPNELNNHVRKQSVMQDYADKSNVEEDNPITNLPLNVNVPHTATSDLKPEDVERRMRVKRYKEYLDMQIKLKNEKLQYERNNRIESNKLMQLRSSELKRMEQENLVKDRMFKDKLAEVYRRQIAEQSILRKGHSMDHNDQNNFSGLMEVNRKRYFKVALLLLVEIR